MPTFMSAVFVLNYSVKLYVVYHKVSKDTAYVKIKCLKPF